ncbi:hypothetical protein ZYGR_0AD04130 [Zygosaccharomyces rouxii]|uniref:Uncharacterized protein n=1 Tax=Zygosaccharomyces rouxii TaxID=4956 RepID=A0A1Q3A6M6_ZYGRO|nr:hypothetical protein ZYGR_0AD04130 [Zygosaccharomyces rouxii]
MSLQLLGRDQIDVHYDNASQDLDRSKTDSQSPLIRWIDKRRHSLRRLCQFKVYKISLTHIVVLITWVSLLLKFTNHYRKLYQNSALLATMCTNVLLFGISDSMAQSILCYFSTHMDPVPQVIDDMVSRLRRPAQIIDDDNDSDDLSVFNDYGEPLDDDESVYDFSAPDSHKFNFFRWVCFMFWGFILSFFQVPWYKFLNYFYTEDPTVVQVLERVLSDQLLYSPVSLYCFFAYSNYVMEGGNAETFSKKIQVLYLSTLGCNYLLWPLVQFINFLLMPKHFQVPFSSSVGILWNCFLSMRNASNSIN